MDFIRKNWEVLALNAILVVAFLIRFVGLTRFPAGFHADEASFGYDAYSIIQSGKDQWGNFLPLAFKSFGDYKASLYGYLDTIFVAIFGLSKFATRLPGPVIGTLSVFAVYLLVCQIFKNRKLGLIASFLLAVNPWSVMLGRGAFESNLITFLAPLGIYLFLRGLEKPKFLGWSSFVFGTSLFSYQASKLVIPLLVLGLSVIYCKKLRKIGIRKLILPIVIFIIFLTGMFYTFIIGGGSRVAERSITQGALEEGAKAKIEVINTGVNPLLAKIEHNKYQVVFSRFVNNYSQYLSPEFLFINGAGEPTYGMIPGIGVISIFEGILFIGLIPYYFGKSKKEILIVLLWLIVGILPAALSTGIGYAGNRASGMLPALQILAVLGFLGWIIVLRKIDIRLTWIISGIFAILMAFNIYSFVNRYFFKVPESFYSGMLYGDLEVSEWLKDGSGVKNVFISRSLSEPQIFIAFGQKWDVKDYQEATKNWDLKKANVFWLDQIGEYKLGKYTFKSIDWKKDVLLKNTILVAKPSDFPPGTKPSKIIYDPNGAAQVYVQIN